jgi:hypothetical protein
VFSAQLQIVRSRPLAGRELVRCVDLVRNHCKQNDFVSVTNGQIHSFPLQTASLPNIDAFQPNSEVSLTAYARGTLPRELVAMICQIAPLTLDHAVITGYVQEVDSRSDASNDFDLTISAGRSADGYFCGVNLYPSSKFDQDAVRRGTFFRDVVSELGLSDQIVVQSKNGTFRIQSSGKWKLWFPSVKLDGSDPGGFQARGFSDIDTAVAAAKRLVSRFGSRAVGGSAMFKLSDDGYKKTFCELSTHWKIWDVRVLGSLTANAVDVLKGGELSNTSPPRIPAFEWYGARSWVAYGSVSVENGQRYLEISTDSASVGELQKRIEFLNDFKFEAA